MVSANMFENGGQQIANIVHPHKQQQVFSKTIMVIC